MKIQQVDHFEEEEEENGTYVYKNTKKSLRSKEICVQFLPFESVSKLTPISLFHWSAIRLPLV